jgi:hypothetical protein
VLCFAGPFRRAVRVSRSVAPCALRAHWLLCGYRGCSARLKRVPSLVFCRGLGLLLGVCAGLTLGCSDSAGANGATGQDVAGGACNAVIRSATGLSQMHVAECSPIDYPDEPPIGGEHYGVWAAFQSYSFPVPRGYWVHDLEHGAVVFSYNCPDGCDDEVAQVQSLIDAFPVDPVCDGKGVERRVVLTPDPLLDVRWGISAWGHTLRADCVDEERFTQFYVNHFGRGPESICNPGSDFGGVPPCQ